MTQAVAARPHGALTLKRNFSCAHFYRQPVWDEKKNRETFGKCFTEYGHGHDYQLEVTFSSGDEASLSKILDPIIERLDHQHLNFVIPEFKIGGNAIARVPTTENLALYLREQIKVSAKVEQLKLFERPDLWVEIT